MSWTTDILEHRWLREAWLPSDQAEATRAGWDSAGECIFRAVGILKSAGTTL